MPGGNDFVETFKPQKLRIEYNYYDDDDDVVYITLVQYNLMGLLCIIEVKTF